MIWVIMNQYPTYSGKRLDAFDLLYSFNYVYVKTQKISDKILEMAWAAIKCDVYVYIYPP